METIDIKEKINYKNEGKYKEMYEAQSKWYEFSS